MNLRFLPLALLILLPACDLVDATVDDQDYVVEAYLVADQPLRAVRVSRSTSVNARYDVTAQAVVGADVVIELLGVSGEVTRRYRYRPLPEEPGVYIPSEQTFPLVTPVIPGATYRLVVDLPDGAGQLTSTTTVPGTFEITRVSADTVKYQGPVSYALDVTRSISPNRQSIFVFSTEALAPSIEALTPFYHDIVEPDNDTDEDELDEFIVTNSPPVNEGNYDINPDGTLTIRLPWFAVAFYGPQRITTSAIDDNLYDFLRSQGIQQGGSTLGPGEIPNVIDHVEGGTGVFGSFAFVSSQVYISR